MKKLNLPVIKRSPPQTRWLSMDQYLNFISFNLSNVLKDYKKVSSEWKKILAVNVPFSLK